MAIVAGFDVHRAQITFDALDPETGEVNEAAFSRHAGGSARVGGPARRPGLHVAVEACTGWLFVCEALVEAGAVPHLAEPVETARCGAKAARQDRPPGRPLAADAAVRGSAAGGLDPAGAHREWRTRARLRKTLVDERTSWLQRVQPRCFTTALGRTGHC